jgi:hypothetical protein
LLICSLCILLQISSSGDQKCLSFYKQVHVPVNLCSSRCHRTGRLADFCITKDIPPTSATATSCLDISSDHSPLLISLANYPLEPVTPPHHSNRQTNWDLFRHLITESLTLKFPLKTPEDTEEAVKLFNDTVQWVGWTTTSNPPAPLYTHGCPPFIRQCLEEKRQLRKRWQHTRTPENKR